VTVARRKGDAGKCDELASRLVRMRGYCEYPGCGSTQTLQCCHIVPRRYSRTRTRIDNLLCLCGTHHFEVDNFADSMLRVVQEVYGVGHYMQLRHDAEQTGGQRFDWTAERARLQALWDRRPM
jgi:hypothetical protein